MARGDQILVQMPGVTDVARAKEIIRSTALLELKIVEDGPAPSREALLAARGGQVPPDMEVVPGAAEAGGTGPVYYLVKRIAGITGRDLRNARPVARREQSAGRRLLAEPARARTSSAS